MAVFSVTNLMDSGMGNLREAIGSANTQAGADTINFNFGSDFSGGTIDLTSGSLGISDSLTINGLGADLLTLDAQNNSRVFSISDGNSGRAFNVFLDGLTITGGNATPGGGIFNQENLTVANSIISGNTGGGIFNGGSPGYYGKNLTVTNSIISGNQGTGIASGDFFFGDARVTVQNSTISNNSDGGIAISNNDYGLVNTTVTNSTISGNQNTGISVSGSDDGRNFTAIANSTISNNQNSGISSNGLGDSLIVTDSTITGNEAEQGGGIRNSYASVTVENSEISGNQAERGGGIFNQGGQVVFGRATLFSREAGEIQLNNSLVAENAAGEGGGIANQNGFITLQNSTVSGNTASGNGAGIINSGGLENLYPGAFGEEGVLTASNSTIAENTAGGEGGGIFNDEGFLTLSNSTVSGNTASSGGSGVVNRTSPFDYYYNYFMYREGEARVNNTIIAANADGTDIAGEPFIDGGFNLIGSGDGAEGFIDGVNGNIVGTSDNPVNPLLGPLQDNGGPTPTQALLPGSPAFNAGDPNFTPPPFTDQRGFERVRVGRVDIGAVEAVPGPEATLGWLLGLAALGAAKYHKRRRS